MVSAAKHYLGFLFDREPDVGLHCTHCYFGTLNQAEVVSVIQLVGHFFNYHPIYIQQPVFNKRAFFGPNKDIPVLLAGNPQVFLPVQLLRGHFSDLGLIKSEFPYNPHVTTRFDHFTSPVVLYGLVRNGRLIYQWPVNGAARA